jgi:diguanylate cyclase (GGDEF)-like protein
MADTKRLDKAEKYLQRGRLDAALDEYLLFLEEDPGNEVVRQRAADVCLRLGRSDDAVTLLRFLLEQQLAAGDGARATVTYKKLARLLPAASLLEHTFRYAEVCEKSHKKEALEAYESVLRALLPAGRLPDAAAVIKRIAELDPTPENLGRLAELAARIGDKKTAISAFLQIGEMEEAGGRDASLWYERAYAVDNADPRCALAHGRALLACGKAAEAADILAPLAHAPDRYPDIARAVRETYAKALLSCDRLHEAEPFVWEMFERDSRYRNTVARLLDSFFARGDLRHALDLAHKLETHEFKRGNQRDFVALIRSITDKYPPTTDVLEYMVGVFNSVNREHEYCQTLLQLFEIYFAGGNFLKAADCLDRAAEVDAYEPGHEKRLEMLRGKIDSKRWNAVAGRLTSIAATTETNEPQDKPDKESTVLEDLLLQAEIYLQYSLRSKAVERLERINKLFPHEEEKNDKLREVYENAGFVPEYHETAAAPTVAAAVPRAVADENAVDNIARVNEITRNIYRQGSVKDVLFAAVNDVGRHWKASRCVASLCVAGKPPSAALEYCAPGVKRSDVMALVKLIGGLQPVTAQRGPTAIPDVLEFPELAPVRQWLTALGIVSLVAVPLADFDAQTGLLILEQCDGRRVWGPTDTLVLKTIADHMALAINNVRLRSLVKNLAVTEEKSGLLKRSSYVDVLLSEVRRGIQQNSPVTVMLAEFGNPAALLKHGEAAVENMMEQAGQIVCSQIRQNDVAVRYGVATVGIILADTNDKSAFFVVDKLRKAVAGVRAPGGQSALDITAGIAEAVMQSRFDAVDIVTEVINRAESALEAARNDGGNHAQALAPLTEAAASA